MLKVDCSKGLETHRSEKVGLSGYVPVPAGHISL